MKKSLSPYSGDNFKEENFLNLITEVHRNRHKNTTWTPKFTSSVLIFLEPQIYIQFSTSNHISCIKLIICPPYSYLPVFLFMPLILRNDTTIHSMNQDG